LNEQEVVDGLRAAFPHVEVSTISCFA
jgi:hypothetical protein